MNSDRIPECVEAAVLEVAADLASRGVTVERLVGFPPVVLVKLGEKAATVSGIGDGLEAWKNAIVRAATQLNMGELPAVIPTEPVDPASDPAVPTGSGEATSEDPVDPVPVELPPEVPPDAPAVPVAEVPAAPTIEEVPEPSAAAPAPVDGNGSPVADTPPAG